PDAGLFRRGVAAPQDADEPIAVRRPVEDKGLAGGWEHLSALLRGQIVLEQSMLLFAGLLDVEHFFTGRVPADRQAGGDVAGVVTGGLEDRLRLCRLAVARLITQPAGVDDGPLDEEIALRVPRARNRA